MSWGELALNTGTTVINHSRFTAWAMTTDLNELELHSMSDAHHSTPKSWFQFSHGYNCQVICMRVIITCLFWKPISKQIFTTCEIYRALLSALVLYCTTFSFSSLYKITFMRGIFGLNIFSFFLQTRFSSDIHLYRTSFEVWKLRWSNMTTEQIIPRYLFPFC